MMELQKKVVDLGKKAAFQISKLGLEDFRAEVVFVLDISKSMFPLYKDGTMQATLERVLALALSFDDNEACEVYLFGSDATQIATVTLENIEGYTEREILEKHNINGATRYATALKLLEARYSTAKAPVYVVFLTDGNNSDKPETEALLRSLSRFPVFFKFVGIGSETFSFLEKLDDLSGRTVDNADYIHLSDLNTVTASELYVRLLQEVPEWIPSVRAAGVL